MSQLKGLGKYSRVITAALREPWAITPDMRAVIFDLLMFRMRGGRLTPDEIKARIGHDEDDEDQPSRRQSRIVRPTNASSGGAVAVIPIYGVIAHRTFEASSGMTSAELIGGMLRQAVANSEVTSILLDVSSPGGGVTGVPELAREIAAVDKPVWAIANGLAASAGYWLAAQADRLIVVPSGEAGSVGVYSMHADYSKWLEKEGIVITTMSAGDYKVEGNPWEPLTEEAKAFYQRQVNEVYDDFVKAVATGRSVSQAKVRNDFGQGRTFMADELLSRGMADAALTFEDTVAEMSSLRPRRSRAAATALSRTLVSEDSSMGVEAAVTAHVAPEGLVAVADIFDDTDLAAARMSMALELDAER